MTLCVKKKGNDTVSLSVVKNEGKYVLQKRRAFPICNKRGKALLWQGLQYSNVFWTPAKYGCQNLTFFGKMS